MFVGEGPGADEDAQGEPFVGRAGQLLNNMIKVMGLKREEVYIAKVVVSNSARQCSQCFHLLRPLQAFFQIPFFLFRSFAVGNVPENIENMGDTIKINDRCRHQPIADFSTLCLKRGFKVNDLTVFI